MQEEAETKAKEEEEEEALLLKLVEPPPPLQPQPTADESLFRTQFAQRGERRTGGGVSGGTPSPLSFRSDKYLLSSTSSSFAHVAGGGVQEWHAYGTDDPMGR
jgi:hypothetical protein